MKAQKKQFITMYEKMMNIQLEGDRRILSLVSEALYPIPSAKFFARIHLFVLNEHLERAQAAYDSTFQDDEDDEDEDE